MFYKVALLSADFGGKLMTLRNSLVEMLKLYEAIYREIEGSKQSEYKRGLAEGMSTVLEAVVVCLEDHPEEK